MFASEVLFQGEVFSREANELEYNIKTPMALARKFGASKYSTFRRYVTTNSRSCCVVVLEPSVPGPNGSVSADVRRVVMSKSFATVYDNKILSSAVTSSHPLAPVIPVNGKRMTFDREIGLLDRNRDNRVCIAEAFDTKLSGSGSYPGYRSLDKGRHRATYNPRTSRYWFEPRVKARI